MKTLSERKLMRACAKFILGEATGVKIKGSPARVGAFQEVLSASRCLYQALHERRSLGEVKGLIEAKHTAADNFKRATGIVWPL